MTQWGHSLITPTPALTPLVADMKDLKPLAGLRSKARLTLLSSKTHPHPSPFEDEGEVLFTTYGLSGIVSMAFGEYLTKGGTLSIDFSPGANLGKEDLNQELLHRRKLFTGFTLESFFTGLFHKLIGFAILKKAGFSPLSLPCEDLTDEDLKRLYDTICGFEVSVTATKGFDQAQVTAGGIDTKDFSSHTMESTLQPNAYVSGELLDVHGPCGGYNLLFAFTRGLVAGNHVGEKSLTL